MEKNRSPFSWRKFHRGIALALCACFLAAFTPLDIALADGPSSISPSATKVYVRFADDAQIFTTPQYSSGITVPKGTVLQLVADKTYTMTETQGEGEEAKEVEVQYYCLFYENKAYNVRAKDVTGNILTADGLLDYMKNTLWAASSFRSLRRDMGLVGDVRVHGLQLALQTLGHYTGNIDGTFGAGTESAVRNFQRANKLEVDGRAGPLTQKALYPLALQKGVSDSGGGSGGTSGEGTTSTTGTLRTTDSVNLRKGHSTSTARLAVVPRNTSLTYFDTSVSKGVVWYKVVYRDLTGWLMGTFVNASGGGSSGGGTGSGSTSEIGTVTITKPGTRVRQTPNGNKTGTVLAKGSVVSMLADRVYSGGYGWYKIQTGSGLVGYVRDDCSTGSLGGGSSGGGSGVVTPSSSKVYFETAKELKIFSTKEKPETGLITVPNGLVLQLVSPTTYTMGEGDAKVEYCSLYYQNKSYNALYSDVKDSLYDAKALNTYLTQTVWNSSYQYSLKQELALVGDVKVHAAQLALNVLGFYTGALDGNFGSGTASAVRNFQRKNSLTVDGSLGPKTWAKLFPAALKAYGGYVPGTPGTSTGDFGVVRSVEKASWNYGDDGASLFAKNSTATVMDLDTKKVFTIYRWSGGNHADCVPYTANDTKTMCDIVDFPYNSKAPSSSQLTKIKNDTGSSNATYTWPDFKNAFGGAKNIGSAWDRRAALLNVNGRVFPVSIYGWPHGFNGTDSFSKSKFPNSTLFYVQNNYYGMMCVHFSGSRTHGGSSEDTKHKDAIDRAWTYAKSQWPSLVKK